MDKESRLISLERPPIIEKAILVRLVLPSDSDEEVEESLAEMRQLAWTAGADILCTFCQRRPTPCPGTLIGKGKCAEIRAACDELEADLAIFDSDLTPTQGARLQDLLDVKVVDRTQLILDIFAQRAQTNEGKHQVELAQLQYQLPRLTGRGAIMRQKGGIGLRGPGEQKLEVDRRVIRRRIALLQHEIDEIQKSRRVQRKRRQQAGVATIALVGYTNAGKSSLLRALAGADVLIEDKLFATLDPTARRRSLPSGREAIFVDTVGFIRKLPHSLVAAFRATLEEVNEADLMLIVADAAHPAVEEHVRAVFGVLDEINASGKPFINVFNKIDKLSPDRLRELHWKNESSVAVSALENTGITELLTEVEKHLKKQRQILTLRIPHSQSALAAKLHNSARVLEQHYDHDGTIVVAEVDETLIPLLSPYIIEE